MGKKSKVSENIITLVVKLFKKIFKNFKKMPILAQLAIVMCLFIVFFKKKNNEPFKNSNSGAKITFFYMNGCGHCDNMKPEWSDFENNWNDNNIVINKKEQSEARELCEKYNIKGFPTVIFTIDGEIPENSINQEHIYNGERTSSSFNEWANEMKETFM